MPNRNGGKENSQESAAKTNIVAPPTLPLPKGGCAISGIGEKFAANPVTGTASLTVPIYTSPGRSGFGPQLSLSYDSGSGNGRFGFGWSLDLPQVTRKTDKGLPQYHDADESDTFILSGVEDLMPSLSEAAGHWTRDVTPARRRQSNFDRHGPRIWRASIVTCRVSGGVEDINQSLVTLLYAIGEEGNG